MSQAIESPPAQHPKMMIATIATALITAMTTLGVTYIGKTGQDTGAVTTLQKTISELRGELERVKGGGATDAKGSISPSPSKTVSGTVSSLDGKPLKSRVDVYLMSQENGLPTTQTDDNGEFIFREVPPGHYSILVREGNGMSGITYLNEDKPEVALRSVLIKYRVRDKGGN